MSTSYSQTVYEKLIRTDPLKWQDLLKKLISNIGLTVYLKIIKKPTPEIIKILKYAILLEYVYPLGTKLKYSKLPILKNFKSILLNSNKRVCWNVILLILLKPFSRKNSLRLKESDIIISHSLSSQIIGDALYEICQVKTNSSFITSHWKNHLSISRVLEKVPWSELKMFAKQAAMCSILIGYSQIHLKQKPRSFYLKQLTSSKRHLMMDFALLFSTSLIYHNIKEHKLWLKLWKKRKNFSKPSFHLEGLFVKSQVFSLKHLQPNKTEISAINNTSQNDLSERILQYQTSLHKKIISTSSIDVLINSFQWCLFKYGFIHVKNLPKLRGYQKVWGLMLLMNSINQIKYFNIPKSFLKSILKNFIETILLDHLPLNNLSNVRTLKIIVMIFSNYFI